MIISISIAVIYVSFFLFPVMKKIKLAKQQVNNYRVNDKIYSKKSNSKNISVELLLNMENNDEIAYNIKIISDLVNIMINKISFGDSCEINTKAGSVYAVPVNVDLTGDLNNIINFINNIEHKSQMYEIISLDINPTITLNEASNNAQISLRYFYFGGM